MFFSGLGDGKIRYLKVMYEFWNIKVKCVLFYDC